MCTLSSQSYAAAHLVRGPVEFCVLWRRGGDLSRLGIFILVKRFLSVQRHSVTTTRDTFQFYLLVVHFSFFFAYTRNLFWQGDGALSALKHDQLEGEEKFKGLCLNCAVNVNCDFVVDHLV